MAPPEEKAGVEAPEPEGAGAELTFHHAVCFPGQILRLVVVGGRSGLVGLEDLETRCGCLSLRRMGGGGHGATRC